MGFLQSIVNAFGTRSSREVAQKPTKTSRFPIPDYRKALLFFSTEEPPEGSGITIQVSITNDGNITNHGIAEPSTIYRDLPVSNDEVQIQRIAKLDYFPSYKQMSPSQRSLYLTWLGDVAAPVETGYVFVYFYGLERHLVYGKFDEAVKEIMLLRQHHDNGSFQSYSAAAVVHACLLRRRLDVLQELYLNQNLDYFGNSVLLILHHQNLDLMPDILLKLAMNLRGVNRKYLREVPDLYEISLRTELIEKFDKESYPFAEFFPLNLVFGVSYPIFANYSLPSDVRTPALPNLMDHQPFEDELGSFFHRVHERTKVFKKEERRRASTAKKRSLALPTPTDSDKQRVKVEAS
jgi:hypothetical protein